MDVLRYFLLLTVLGEAMGLASQALKNNVYNVYIDVRRVDVYSSATARSAVDCCVACANSTRCRGANFHRVSRECQLSESLDEAIDEFIEYHPDWALYTTESRVSPWQLAFVGLSGRGGLMYDAFLFGNGTTSSLECPPFLPEGCSQHYRWEQLDDWASLAVKKVKLSIYKNGELGAYLTFNATGSGIDYWFTRDRMLNSSWSQAAVTSYRHMAMIGYSYETYRRFMMCVTDGGCHVDTYYFVVSEAQYYSCQMDIHPNYPQYIFSTIDGTGMPNNMLNMAYADSIAIYIQM